MARTVGIGHQDFSQIIQNHYFYVDKTAFIKEWWENGDAATLINRPRRFGKTLNMSMLEQFFSVEYADRGDLFTGLSIWQEEKYRRLQGTYPVIALSFAEVKEKQFLDARKMICQIITNLYGQRKDIYNPWSILNFLDKGKFAAYWANTSSNRLAGKLIQEGSPDVKMVMEDLLKGKAYHTAIDEQIIFSQLDYKASAVWSLLLASGYLRVEHFFLNADSGRMEYDLMLTNQEVRFLFEQMIEDWFAEYTTAYNGFVKALLRGNCREMNFYMNKVALDTFSFFDSGNKPSEKSEPERFYHGFVLGLLVDLKGRYVVTSNRESGLGRYDVILEPCCGRADKFPADGGE